MSRENSVFSIEGRTIGAEQPPFLIAEMSGNHNQSLEVALAIVDAVADAGADALKLQTYTADTLTIPGIASITDESSLWHGKTLYELYEEAHTPWEWHESIMSRAKERGLIVFSSPFDETAVDFLLELNVPAFKIASFENSHWPLLRKIAATGKPVIMSTGATSLSELSESVRILREAGCTQLALLKCTSSYPATPADSNIATIPHLRQLFQCEAGLSDHTFGVGVAIASVAQGASIIEKHFCLDRSLGGVDSSFSLEPSEFRLLVEESRKAHSAIGQVQYDLVHNEEKSRIFRRSIYIVEDMKAGEVLNEKNIRIIRPGFGLQPKYFEHVLGQRINRDIERGTPLQLTDLFV